jgi:hypothetical protein
MTNLKKISGIAVRWVVIHRMGFKVSFWGGEENNFKGV